MPAMIRQIGGDGRSAKQVLIDAGLLAEGATDAAFEAAIKGDTGAAGWSPVYAVEADGGARRVLKVTGWVGGAGAPPASPVYVGASGFVATAELAQAIVDAASLTPITDQQAASVAAVAAQGDTSVGLVNTAGGTQVTAVNTAGTTQLGNLAAAALARTTYTTTTKAQSNGVASVAVTAGGSGGTNGVHTWTTTGGAGAGAYGTLTIAGGAIVAGSVVVQHRGDSYTSAPTIVPNAATVGSLTGATLTASLSQNQPAGTVYGVADSSGLTYYQNVAGTPTVLTSIMAAAILSARLEEQEEWAARDAFRERMKNQYAGLPKAAIGCAVASQSLMTKRLSTITPATPAGCFMLVGGGYAGGMAFTATNALYPCRYNEVSSCVAYAESGGEGPGAGFVSAIIGRRYQRAYFASAAVGARTLEVLSLDGPLANAHAFLKYMCADAIAAGHAPEPLLLVAHGEANATAATSLSTYLGLGLNSYQIMQMYAAVAARRPDWVAPIGFKIMQQMSNTGNRDRDIIAAIERLAIQVRNGFVVTTYQCEHTSDRVHASSIGMVQIGELFAHHFERFLDAGDRFFGPEITDVWWSGTSFGFTTSHDTTIDTVFSYGESLNANAFKGLVWEDNGTEIDITSVVAANGTTGANLVDRRFTGTLATTPSGTVAQQRLNYAQQRTTATLTAEGVGANRSGGLLRLFNDRQNFASIGRSASLAHKGFMPPQNIAVRAA